MPKIIIDSICKVYPGSQGVEALKNINLSIDDKEFICILGPSGCGKSTLLEIIAGLQLPTRGRVLLDDRAVVSPNRDIGVVFQDSSLFPWRTVRENVEFGLEINGVDKASRKKLMEKYIQMVKLNGFEDRYPDQLSGGMRQRVGLARTLINNPKVLLMDEPFGAVDHLTRLQLQNDVTDIWEKEKKTVIFITHDVPEAVFLADRVVLLDDRPSTVKQIFNISLKRPRSRNDAAILELQEKIYKTLNYPGLEYDPEYCL